VNNNSNIRFFYQSGSFSFPNRELLKNFLIRLLRSEQQKVEEIRIVFCTDEEVLRINRQFLNHNYFTDIITFNLSNSRQPINADIYISIDRVRDNARQLGVSFKEELHRVIFHGILHLCGYNDKSSQQIKKMREREDHYLRLYFGK
jgi:rRNA maturation RNase YbeY